MELSELPRLPAGQYVLRAFRQGDAHLVRSAARDPYIAAVTSLPTTPTARSAAEFIDRQIGRLDEGTGCSFAIAALAGDRACGQIGLWPDYQRPRTAAVGYWLVPEERGKGVASAALDAITGWATAICGMNVLELFIEPANLPSIAVAERCGYRFAQRAPQSRLVGGESTDMDLYVFATSAANAR